MADTGRGALYGEIRKAGQALASELQTNTEVLACILPGTAFENSGQIVMGGEIHRAERALHGAILSDSEQLIGELPGKLVFYAAGDLPAYDGPYEVTPSRQEQVLKTAGKYLPENIKVNKIPENYGLISYNQDRVIKIT